MTSDMKIQNNQNTSMPILKKNIAFLDTKIGKRLVGVATLATILIVWEIYAAGISRALLAPPSEIFSSFIRQAFVEKTMWGPLGDSLLTLVLGFGLSVILGIPIGILMGRNKSIEYVIDPYVSFLYALPHASLVPLMIIWLGFELKFRLAYVVISAVFPVIINTMVGVKNVSPDLLDTGRAFCASEKQTLGSIVLPSSLPYIFAGTRQAFSSSWVAVVVAEMTATLSGVGGSILRFVTRFQTADMFVSILLIMGIAAWIQAVSDYIQGRLTPWQKF